MTLITGNVQLPLTAPYNPVDRALRLYDDHPPGIRAFVRARHLLCPLAAIEREVPREGRILDLGCGHGLFSAVMALGSPGRTLMGVDPSEEKIRVARRLEKKLGNASFRQGTVEGVEEGGLDGVTILDVLYLLPVEQKARVLAGCRRLLKPGGRLVLKTNDTHPAWKYRWAWLQEVAMTRIGLTLNHGSLYFLSCRQHRALLEEAGFVDIRVEHLPTRLPYPHTLFICQR